MTIFNINIIELITFLITSVETILFEQTLHMLTMFNVLTKVDIKTLELVISLSVAVGTILLAHSSYKSISFVKEQVSSLQIQTKLLFVQSNYLKLQQAPFLKMEDFRINGNEISLKLTNIGNGIATQVGVKAGFYILDRTFVEPPNDEMKKRMVKSEDLPKNTYEAITNPSDGTLWYKYTINTQQEQFGENYIKYLKEEKNGRPIIEIGKTGIFKCVPEFWGQVGEHRHQGFSYEELLRYCKEHGIKFLGFRFDLVYMDLAEDIQMPEELITRGIDIISCETLEDVLNKGTPLDLFTLGQFDIEKRIGGKLESSYKAKHLRNCFEYFDNE